MSKLDWSEIEPKLDLLLDLPKEERKTFIEREFRDQGELKAQLFEYLDSITESEGWLENPELYRNDSLTDFTDRIEKAPEEKNSEDNS